MSRRGDNLHKRKDGRWEGRCKIGVNENGKTIYKSVYARSYAECKAKLENCKNERGFLQPKRCVFQFRDVLELWIDSNRIRIKGSTLLKYEYLIDTHIAPGLGNYKTSDLTSFMINDFLDKKLNSGSKKEGDSLSSSYVRTMAIIIESAINYAVKEGLCLPLKNPIHKPAVQKGRLTILTVDEQKEIESVLANENSNVALGIIIALYTGLRIGEICALRWEDIDLGNGLIYVNHTVSREISKDAAHKTQLVLSSPKTKTSKRIVPIPSLLKSILENAPKDNSFVVSGSDTFADTRTFDYQFKKLFRAYKMNCIRFHTIRHTFATRCLQSGMDVKTLSEILGHASATTTLNTYVHSSLEAKRKQLEQAFASTV